jgi:hypothetical protein
LIHVIGSKKIIFIAIKFIPIFKENVKAHVNEFNIEILSWYLCN